MEVKKVYLKTEHGYIFHAKLYNSDDYTYFGCKTWRALCKTYAFEPDMVITFDIRPEDDIEGNRDIWVNCISLGLCLPSFAFKMGVCVSIYNLTLKVYPCSVFK